MSDAQLDAEYARAKAEGRMAFKSYSYQQMAALAAMLPKGWKPPK